MSNTQSRSYQTNRITHDTYPQYWWILSDIINHHQIDLWCEILLVESQMLGVEYLLNK